MVYDYRHELIALLAQTGDDRESLLQTQRSLTVILNVLNHFQKLDEKYGDHHRHSNRQHHQNGHQGRDHFGTDNSQLLNSIFSQTMANAQSEQGKQTTQHYSANDSSAASAPAYVIHRASQADDNSASSASPLINPYGENPFATNTSEADAEPSEEELLARDHQYVVHRRLSGALIHHSYYPEAVLEKLNFQLDDGDVVELDPDHKVRGLWTIRRATGQHVETNATPIRVIRYATLSAVSGTKMLQINKTIKGDSLVDESPANTIVIDPAHFAGKRTLEAGMVVDYAYYDHGNGLNDAQKGTIRWVHEDSDFDTIKAPEKPKTVKHVSKPRHEFKDHADYDLKKKHVLIITGLKNHNQDLKEVVSKHGGVYYGLDASMEKNMSSSKLKKAIKDAQMVIICTDHIHHRVSQAAIHQAKRHNLPYAMATTTSNAVVERAMFRALNGDPSYEATGTDASEYENK